MKNNFFKSSLLLALVVTMTVSCKKKAEETLPDNTDLKAEKTELNQNFRCKMVLPKQTGLTTEANGYSAYRWPNGSTIKVRFNTGGSSYIRSKIKQYAKSWEAYANVTFLFVADNAAADIKIGFDEPNTSWSNIGTDVNYSKTMNFGWFYNTTTDEEFRRTTVHEFGHALGLDHEQAHPDANIPWNKQAVYDYYTGPEVNWTKEDVDYNVLLVNDRVGLDYNAYDPKSIMHYPVDARFTTNHKTIAANNTKISQGDIAWVKKYYPGRN